VPVQLGTRRQRIEIWRMALDPRAARRVRGRTPATSSTPARIFSPFFVVFAEKCQKTAETGPQIWSEFSAKNRELAEIRQFCQNFFRIEGRVAPAAERNPPQESTGRASRAGNRGPGSERPGSDAGGPGRSGQLPRPVARNRRATRRRPRRLLALARAMFFTNNMVKNDMNVSRETLPIF